MASMKARGQLAMAEKAAAGAGNNVYNSMQFASVQDSRENLFSAGLNNGLDTPVPPKFQFQERLIHNLENHNKLKTLAHQYQS